jgi:hypothetical protein
MVAINVIHAVFDAVKDACKKQKNIGDRQKKKSIDIIIKVT